MDIAGRGMQRQQVLLALYSELGDTPLASVKYREVAGKIHLEDADGHAVAQFLVDEGLAERFALGGEMALTHCGRKQAEELLAGVGGDSALTMVLSIPSFAILNASSIYFSNRSPRCPSMTRRAPRSVPT
jgi:hypothetical protein